MTSLAEKRSTGLKEIAASDNKFVPKIYSKVTSKLEGNVIMSALSVECLLAIACLGSKGNTEKKIKKALSLPSNHDSLSVGFSEAMKVLNTDEKESVTTKVSNHVYIPNDAKLLDDFEYNANKIQKGIIQNVDFSNAAKTTKQINDQVKKDTQGKIKNLFSEDSIDAKTQLVLVNALYFKGKWKTEFKKRMTEKGDFHVSASKKVRVDLMQTQGKYSTVEIKNADATALQLPYEDERFSMVVILPNQRYGIKKLEQDLTKIDFSKDIQFDKPTTTYQVALPKFKIETTMNLVQDLKDLGINDLFEAGKADLSGITGSKGMFASSLVQKAFIEVNEEGTEAAAATGIIMTSRMLSIPPSFICDHPFIFFIKDSKTGLILFNGRVMDPKN